MTNIQATRNEDGSYDVTVTVESYSTTLKGSPIGSLRTEAEAIEHGKKMLPLVTAEAAEYFAMQF
jgi:hypothetical protein